MNVAKRHIEGATRIPAEKGGKAVNAIVIPLLPARGTWVITGTVQAIAADGKHGPLTCFPQFTGNCLDGVATSNNPAAVQQVPTDHTFTMNAKPGGISLVGADGTGLQVEIALQGEADTEVYWSWALDVTIFEIP